MLETPLSVGAAGIYHDSPNIRKLLTFENPYGEVVTNYKVKDGLIWVPRTLVPEITNDQRVLGRAINCTNNFTPRHDDQARVAREACALVEQRDFIIQAPTGYGKTYVGSTVIAHYGRKALVLTTKEDIIKQWNKAIHDVLGENCKVGIWRGDSIPPADADIVIGLINSVMKGPDRYPGSIYKSFGLVLCDEVHRMGADKFSQAMWWLPAVRRIGLSATVTRKDGRSRVFKEHIGKVEVRGLAETLIPRVIMRDTEFTTRLKVSPKQMGAVSSAIAKDMQRNKLLVQFMLAAYKKKRNTFVFSDIVKHLHLLRDMCIEWGIPEEDCGYYIGLSNDVYEGGQKAREKQREAMTVCPLLFTTYKMASEATDFPWMDTAVYCTPKADVNQITGRIRREYGDNRLPVVFHPRDRKVKVLDNYAKSCLTWYKSIGAEVIER